MLDYILCYIAYPTLNVRFNDRQNLVSEIFHLSYSQHLMLAGINVSDIYFRTTGFLIPQINIHRDIENIQHYIFAYTDSNNI